MARCTTRRAILLGTLAAAAVLSPSRAGPIRVHGPIDTYGAKTRDVRRVHIIGKYTYWSGARKTQEGAHDMWFDKTAGRYLAVERCRSFDRAGAVSRTWASGVLVNEKGATTWYIRDGRPENCFRRRARDWLPRGDRLSTSRYHGGFVLDALFGYRNLSRVFSFRAARSPLPERKKLHWFAVQVNAGAPEAKSVRWLARGQYRTWFGFGRRSGWLRAVVTENTSGWRSVKVVTKIVRDPDTEGVFVLPEQIRHAEILDPDTREPIPEDER